MPWIRAVDRSVDYDYDADSGIWDLRCEAVGCGERAQTARWIIGWTSEGRTITRALCDWHAQERAQILRMKLPLALRGDI